MLAVTVIFFHISGFVHIGHFAVYCFFILSGYWVANMYEKKYIHSSTLVYYCSRLWRLLPVYWSFLVIVCLRIFFLDKRYFNSEKSLFWLFSQLTLIGGNQFAESKLLLTPAWSLDIELQFYFILPLLLYIAKSKNQFITLLVFSSTICTILLIYPVLVINRSVIFYLPYFLNGMYLYKYPLMPGKPIKIITFSLFLLLLLMPYYEGWIWQSRLVAKGMPYHELYNMVLPFFLIFFIQDNVKTKSNSLDRWLGNLSYVLYFSHWIGFKPFSEYIYHLSFSHRVLPVVVYLLITVLLACLIFYIVDKPSEVIRKKWLERKSLSTGAS